MNGVDIIHQIVDLVRNFRDYDRAANLIAEHNISFEELIKSTLRLSIQDIAILGDMLRSR